MKLGDDLTGLMQRAFVGWGNMELETYDASSVAVGNGVLSISAQRAGASFRSGRVTSAGRRGFVPSSGETLRIEARIQLPQGMLSAPSLLQH